MPFPDPLATAFIEYKSDRKGPFVMVLHLFQVGTFTADGAEANALADLLDNTVGANLRACISADCTYNGVQVNINAGGVSYTGLNNDNTGVGAIAGQSLPDYCAAVIQKRTLSPGKSGRGRWYIGCVPEAWNDTGRLSEDATLAYTDLADAAKADESTAGGTWRSGHMSRKELTVVPITSCIVDGNYGTRRKRLVRP